LREQFRLGLFAEAMDKVNGNPANKRDLIVALLNGEPQSIVVGGERRLCTAHASDIAGALPLPRGFQDSFNTKGEGSGKRWLVKWVLLTPALWPEIPAEKRNGSRQNAHLGGWLPNWVSDRDQMFEREAVKAGAVLLLDGPGKEKAARKKLRPGGRIPAQLVAAIVPKPLVVTGWALPNEVDRAEGEAKSTQLAVPAGAVYYFEAQSAEAARALAMALNWHGKSGGTQIMNRRSTLLGEKGYGLGVCGSWEFYEDVAGRLKE
jgi:hypothetical protein